MKKFFKGLLVSASALAVGFAAVFGGKGIAFKPKELSLPGVEEPFTQEEQENNQTQTSHQTRLLNNIMATKGFNVTGEAKLRVDENFLVVLNFDLTGDLSDFTNVKLQGDIDLRFNGAEIKTNISFFNKTIYFAYNDNKFKLETENVMDFVKFLPELGINASLPEELQNIDLITITNLIQSMEEEITPSGDYFFNLELSDLVTLKIKTDRDYNFKGIRMNEIEFENTKIQMDLNMQNITITRDSLVDPSTTLEYVYYQDFKPAFNIFKSLINAFGKQPNSIVLKANVSNEEKEIFGTDLELSYDLNTLYFGVSGSVTYKEKSIAFSVSLQEGDLFLEVGDIKVSIDNETVYSVVHYLLETLEIDVETELLNIVSDLLNSRQIQEMLANINNLIGNISLTENQFSIELDTSALGLNMGILVPTIKFNGDQLESIKLGELNVLGIKLDTELNAKEFRKIEVKKEEFSPVSPVLTLAQSIIPYIKETNFNIGLNAVVERADNSKKDVLVDGGIQFDLDDKHGYGELNIVDSKEYKHNIKADMVGATDFVFSYNDTLNGKFSSKTLEDLMYLILGIIADPDEHFMELFGEIIEFIINMPLMSIVNGDYSILLDTNIFNKLTITDTALVADIALDIIGLNNNSVTVELDYSRDEKANCEFKGIKLYNLDIEGTKISLDASLNAWNEQLEKTRLDRTDMTKYLDFSDIKVLLELGINTSKFNYYHFKMALHLDLPLGTLLDMNIVFDVKIRNNKGNVQVAVDGDIPLLSLLALKINNNPSYDETTKRHLSFYYEEGMFYIKVVESVEEEKWIGFIRLKNDEYDLTTSEKVTVDYFLDNIAEIIMKDMFGFKDIYYNLIVTSTENKEASTTQTSKQMEYEKILSDFKYNENAGTFDFVIDLYSMLHIAALSEVTLKVYSDKETNELTTIELSSNINFIIKIVGVEATIETLEKDQLNDENKITEMDSWIASRADDAENTKIEVSKIKK